MKKQIITTILSAACVFGSISAFAEVTPRVIVDGSEIQFMDQKPVIINDRMLIPIRGVMEATGAKVRWSQELKLAQIQSHDFWRIAEFTIDSEILKASKFRSDMMTSDTEEIKLEVPAQIINDRTMVPLRAVNDAFKYETTWDDETKTAIVKTDRQMPTEATDATIYLTTNSVDVKQGEDVVVYVNIKNLDKEEKDNDRIINGATISLIYDKAKLKLKDATLCNDNDEISGIGATNDEYSEDSMKTVMITTDTDACLKGDGAFYKITFEALAEEDFGTVTLSNRYNTKLGYDTTVLKTEGTKGENMTGVDYFYDTTPLEIR